jgi:predicted site-specific integrase-resolvase
MCLNILKRVYGHMKPITNYKPKYFAQLLGVSVKILQRWDRDGLRKYKKKIKEDEEIAKGIQSGIKTNKKADSKD